MGATMESSVRTGKLKTQEREWRDTPSVVTMPQKKTVQVKQRSPFMLEVTLALFNLLMVAHDLKVMVGK